MQPHAGEDHVHTDHMRVPALRQCGSMNSPMLS